MIGQGSFLWVQATESAAARSGSSLSVFEAKPVLIGASAMDAATGAPSPKTVHVVNMLEQEIKEGDWVPVARSLYGHIVTVAIQGGPAAIIHFQIESDDSSQSSASTTPVADDRCGYKTYTEAFSKRAKVLSQSCGSLDVPAYVVVTDTEKWFFERSDDELEGKTGFAVQMQASDSSGGTGDSSSSGDCGAWEILWIDWFRNRINVTDVIFRTKSVKIERELHAVWNHCKLPDEIIEGDICEDSSSSGSSSGGV